MTKDLMFQLKGMAVTEESPVFMKAEMYDTPAAMREPNEEPYQAIVCAVTDVQYDDQSLFLHALILDTENTEGRQTPVYRAMPQRGGYLMLDADDLDGHMLQMTQDLMQNYHALYHQRQTAPFLVTGRLFTEVPKILSGGFSYYPEIPDSQRVWDLSKEHLQNGSRIRSVNDAEKWMLENHPAYIFGMLIQQDCPSGDFMATAVPCMSYPKGMYETLDGRLMYAQMRAASLGVTMGSERAEPIVQKFEPKVSPAHSGLVPSENVQSSEDDFQL